MSNLLFTRNQRNMITYVLLKAGTESELSALVCEAMEKGYIPFGSPFFVERLTSAYFYQAIISQK